MAKKGDIYLGTIGAEILLSPFGRKHTIADVELSRQDRTASGRLKKEIISVKKKITLKYENIDGDVLETIKTLYNLHSELSLILYTSDTVYEQYNVLMEPNERTLETLQGNGLWSGVTVELNEC